jgi:hypothetical protein
MLVSAVSVISGLFQCCWSRVQCWVWCDENLSTCDSEEARCLQWVSCDSAVRASTMRQKYNTSTASQSVGTWYPYQSTGSAGLVVQLIRIEHTCSHRIRLSVLTSTVYCAARVGNVRAMGAPMTQHLAVSWRRSWWSQVRYRWSRGSRVVPSIRIEHICCSHCRISSDPNNLDSTTGR